ncbi:hypothetical protein METHPM2_530028 [Pseudomonas sp. PM2]
MDKWVNLGPKGMGPSRLPMVVELLRHESAAIALRYAGPRRRLGVGIRQPLMFTEKSLCCSQPCKSVNVD